ncbi:hypothetical protein GH741_17795 [Aquibacillus halophilus]|uniref:Uncharacterized protein n=1 Tax=Aquibacillus halophilus TaxID=930132 RepID=A0A6A8DL40_9BACI|nr:hypothetical protein [Aquibacillus halophilus]MRH44501.1 hypothetical protein [Aquibacillus halophilus]
MVHEENFISFNNINVTSLDSNTGVFIGRTESKGWNVKEKYNTGSGKCRTNQRGKSPQSNNLNVVYDYDIYDHILSKSIN